MAESYSIQGPKLAQTIKFSKPSLSKNELESVLNCLVQDELGYGKIAHRFEKEFARNFRFRHSLALNTRTSAYHLALLGLEVTAGDEVICSSLGGWPVLDAARYTGATLVPVDIDRRSFHPSIEQFMAAVTERTRAVVLEHQFGAYNPQAGALAEALSQHAKKAGHPLYLIEDNSAILGEEAAGEFIGHAGRVCITGFNEEMMITTGQGAMLSMADPTLYGRISRLRSAEERKPGEVRYEYLLTDFQAAMGLEQLTNLPLIMERRQKVGEVMLDILRRTKFETYFGHPEQDTFQSFPVYTGLAQDKMDRFFKSMQIEVERVCAQPLHQYLQANRMEFPNAERLWLKGIRLPCYPHLSKKQMEKIALALRTLY